MDKQTRSLFAVGFAVVAVFMGVNVMVDQDRSSNWLVFAVVFTALALLFWWWIDADERRAKADVERQARESIRQAEDQLRQARLKAARPDPTVPRPAVLPTLETHAAEVISGVPAGTVTEPTVETIGSEAPYPRVEREMTTADAVTGSASVQPVETSPLPLEVASVVTVAPTHAEENADSIAAPEDAIVDTPEPVDLPPVHSEPVSTVTDTVGAEPSAPPVVSDVETSPTPSAPTAAVVEVPTPHTVEVPSAPEDVTPVANDSGVFPAEVSPATDADADLQIVGNVTLPAEEILPVNNPAPLVAPDIPDDIAPDVPATYSSLNDDLIRIEGIGPYYRDLLHNAGITTFAELATRSKADIDTLISAAKGRRSNTTGTWAEQARLAAEGRWDELATYQRNLLAGRGKK